MGQPTTQDEYSKRYAENTKTSGTGIYGVRCHVPCPFCAAPDFMVHAILEVEDAYAKGATCKECGRSMHAIVTKSDSATRMAFVQTGGDDPPPWVPISRSAETTTGVDVARLADVPGSRAIAEKVIAAAVAGEAPRRVTISGRAPEPGTEDSGAPAGINPATGQHRDYWVLSPGERSKGFVRPVRSSYRHVGPPPPKYELRELTDDERARYAGEGYVRYEPYPESESPKRGRLWTQKDLDAVGKGCGTMTTMGRELSETYARQPSFYGSTFCCGCRTHLPVGERGEFVWEGTTERVGT